MAADNQEPDRKNLTFSQAEGLAPLPGPLKLRELSAEARSLLWREIYNIALRGPANRAIGSRWYELLTGWFVEGLHEPVDEIMPYPSYLAPRLKEHILNGPWNEVLDFFQYLLRSSESPAGFIEPVNWCFEKSRTAYLVVPDPPTIMPRATEQEGVAIVEALETLSSAGLDGARAHLLQAGAQLNAGEYADTVRESIHAVESVARKLDPNASGTLGPALKALEEHIAVHPALKKGFLNIYGYTSNEGGIRHALLEDEAQVDLEDAVFMIGACASFTSYLVGKARRAGLITE